MARAVWKGVIRLDRVELPVKLYAAVEDRTVHFRLLHAKDGEPVEQRIVRKSDGREVPKDERRKAFPVDGQTLVILQPEEVEALEPESTRDIEVLRFVPAARLTDPWYERPYLLGPDGDDDGYWALARAVEASARIGIARWVMRRKRYVGALTAANGYLALITLARADQILTIDAGRLPASKTPSGKELDLAAQLVESVAGDFDPFEWKDEHHARVCELIEAKAQGRRVTARPAKPKAATGDLSAALERSLAAHAKEKEKRVA